MVAFFIFQYLKKKAICLLVKKLNWLHSEWPACCLFFPFNILPESLAISLKNNQQIGYAWSWLYRISIAVNWFLDSVFWGFFLNKKFKLVPVIFIIWLSDKKKKKLGGVYPKKFIFILLFIIIIATIKKALRVQKYGYFSFWNIYSYVFVCSNLSIFMPHYFSFLRTSAFARVKVRTVL